MKNFISPQGNTNEQNINKQHKKIQKLHKSPIRYYTFSP